MSSSHLFRSFGKPASLQSALEEPDVLVAEEEKLRSFEQGYRAGWDDCLTAQADSPTHISAEFAQALQDASFTFHDARKGLLTTLEELAGIMVEKLLPECARAGLAGHVREAVRQLSTDAMTVPLEVAVAPEKVEAVQELLDGQLPDGFRVTGLDSLEGNAVCLRVGQRETLIDLERAISDMSEQIDAYLETLKAEGRDD